MSAGLDSQRRFFNRFPHPALFLPSAGGKASWPCAQGAALISRTGAPVMTRWKRIISVSVILTAVICVILAAPITAFLTQSVQYHDQLSSHASGGPPALGAFLTRAQPFDYFLSPAAMTQPDMLVAAPNVTSLTPSSTTAGGPGFTLTVNGSGFLPTFSIHINGSNRSTTYVDSTKLTTPIAG